MSTTGQTTPLCGYCGRPVIGLAVWDAGRAYHAECTHGPGGPLRYAPMPQAPGCTPLRQLTEEDVREIVREELALKTPNDRVEGRDAALSRRVPSHDGLEGKGQE